MACFRVSITYERNITFFVEADDKDTVEGFLDAHPDWQPGDVPGLIDVVGDELETAYYVREEEKINPDFRITEDLDLEEIEL